ncbi:10250_t:CDS:2, partial [Dentiscutata erythropus]
DTNKNNLFNNIFAKTHTELKSLNSELSILLQDTYLTNNNSNDNSNNKFNKLSSDKTYNETSPLSLIPNRKMLLQNHKIIKSLSS